MLATVHPSKEAQNPEHPELKGKSGQSHGSTNSQVQRAHLMSSLQGGPTGFPGRCRQPGSLHTAGVVRDTASPVLRVQPRCPWPSKPEPSLQASLGGCFLCFADKGPHPLF